MVNDIINTFEQKFNKFADTTEAFTSRFVRDNDSAIGTLCFSSFNVEFEYCLECGGMIEKSGLNIIVDLSKRSSYPLKCMMYDIIGLFDAENFSCWFYCFIENEIRMELCFDKLSKDFSAVYPKLKEFVSDEKNYSKIEDALRCNIKNTVGTDIVDDWKNELDSNDDVNADEAYEYLYSLYFGFEQCAFSSYEYRDFLAGNWKKALKKYTKKKSKLIYENDIIRHITDSENSAPIISKEYECLKDGLKEYGGTSGFIPFMFSTLILTVPLFAICVVLYFALSAIICSSSIYSTQTEPYNALCCFLPAFLGGIISGYFMQNKIYRKFFRRKYRKMMEYDSIFNTEKSKKTVKVFFYLIYILLIVSVFLFADYGVSFSDTGIDYKNSYFSVTKQYASYNEIESAYQVVDSDGISDYKICFDNGKIINLSEFVDDEDVVENIAPILEYNGIEFKKISSEDFDKE